PSCPCSTRSSPASANSSAIFPSSTSAAPRFSPTLSREPPTIRWSSACRARPAPARPRGKASSATSWTAPIDPVISAPTTMLEFDVAQSRLATAGSPPSIAEACPLAEARGRILAQTIFATSDLPPADNSAMDGYAIRYADYAAGKRLPVQQRCFAGEAPQPLQAGKAIRLFTGSLIPQGADTGVMQEDGDENDDGFEIQRPPVQGAHVRRRGEDVLKGNQLLAKGCLIGPGEIALLA